MLIFAEIDFNKDLGFVADKCPICGFVAEMHVNQTYRMPFVWFIPVGRRQLICTTFTCAKCGSKGFGDPQAYATFLNEKHLRRLELDEILDLTNPRLAQNRAERTKLEDEARAANSSRPADHRITAKPLQPYHRDVGSEESVTPDPRVKLAFAQLGDFDTTDPRVHELQARLSTWSALAATDQSRLLNDVALFVAQEKRAQDAVYFARQMAQRFKPDVDPFLAVVTLVAGIILAFLSTVFGEPFACVTLPTIGVAAIVLSVMVHRAFRRWKHKRFFRNVFLPELNLRRMALGDALGCLNQVDVNDDKIDPNLRGLARAVPLLNEVLEEGRTCWKASRPTW